MAIKLKHYHEYEKVKKLIIEEGLLYTEKTVDLVKRFNISTSYVDIIRREQGVKSPKQKPILELLNELREQLLLLDQNEVVEKQDFIELPLSKEKTALVDREVFEIIKVVPWNAVKVIHGDVWYAYRSYTTHREQGKHKDIFLHSFILPSASEGFMVDHINRNGLDNRFVNLRYATKSQNSMNSFRKENSERKYSSKYKGVYYDKRDSNWDAFITKDSKRRYLGAFQTEKEAGEDYNQAATELFGEFACLNNIS